MIKNSETRVIRRSQINFNPFNIKNHTDEQIKLQVKNIRKVGLLGGIVWNETSGNLVDGHRRVHAMDLINKYDGSLETDYEIKVEVAKLDEKTEKTQMSYMALANSKADYNLVANIIDDIGYQDVGLTEDEYHQILDLKDVGEDWMQEVGSIDIMEEEFAPKVKEEPREPVTELPRVERTNDEIVKEHAEKPKMTPDEVKAQKEHCNNVNSNYMDKTECYIILNFSSRDEKTEFCEALGLSERDNMVLDGMEFLSNLDS